MVSKIMLIIENPSVPVLEGGMERNKISYITPPKKNQISDIQVPPFHPPPHNTGGLIG